MVSLFSWTYWCVLLLGFGRPRRPRMHSGNSSRDGPAVAALWRAYEWVTVENWGLVMLLNQALIASVVAVSSAAHHQTEPSVCPLAAFLYTHPSLTIDPTARPSQSGACTRDIFVCGVMYRYSLEPMTLRWIVVRLMFGFQERFDLRAAVPIVVLHAFSHAPMVEVRARECPLRGRAGVEKGCLLFTLLPIRPRPFLWCHVQEMGGRSAANAWTVSLFHACLLMVPSMASALIRRFAGKRRAQAAPASGKLKAA